MKTIDNVIDLIGLTVSDFEQEDNVYKYSIEDSNKYGNIYSRLCKQLPDYLSPEDTSETNTITTVFFYENFDIILNADFDNDVYTIQIEEVDED